MLTPLFFYLKAQVFGSSLERRAKSMVGDGQTGQQLNVQ
jgi:hypothetical protein